MLTIQITDTELEQRIVEKAKAIGKSVQQLAQEMLSHQLIDNDQELGFEIPRLDVRQHAQIIDTPLTAEEEELLVQNPDVKPFSHIKDAAKYIHDIRRKPHH